MLDATGTRKVPLTNLLTEVNDMSDMIELNVGQSIDAMAHAFRANRPLFMHGQPGIGKSAAVEEAVASWNRKFNLDALLIDERLGTKDPTDIAGFLIPDREKNVASYLPPSWFPHTGRTDLPEFGVLFLDEATSAPAAVQAAAFQLLQERRCGAFHMKPNWRIVLAGNRLTDGGVVHKLATPLANRVIHVHVHCDVDEWSAWALDNGLPVEVVAFIRFRPELLNTFESHIKLKGQGHAFATPRSWHIASDLWVSRGGTPEPVLLALLQGTVGHGPAAEFAGFCKMYQSLPSIDSILLNPDSAMVPEEPASLYAVATALSARSEPATLQAVVTYLDRVPVEYAVLVGKDINRAKPQLIGDPAWIKWFTQPKVREAFYGR